MSQKNFIFLYMYLESLSSEDCLSGLCVTNAGDRNPAKLVPAMSNQLR